MFSVLLLPPWAVSSHPCADQYSGEGPRGPSADPWSALSQATVLSGPLPCQLNCLCGILDPSPNSARLLGSAWVPLPCAVVCTLFRLETGLVVGSPHRGHSPALPELHWLQTLVSDVVSDSLVILGGGVNPVPAASFGESLDSGEQPGVLELLILASISQWVLEGGLGISILAMLWLIPIRGNKVSKDL